MIDTDNPSRKDGQGSAGPEQSEEPSSAPAPAFSIAQALSMVRKRREQEDQAKHEEERALDEQRKEKAKEKRRRRRENQKIRRKAKLRDVAEDTSEDPRQGEVAYRLENTCDEGRTTSDGDCVKSTAKRPLNDDNDDDVDDGRKLIEQSNPDNESYLKSLPVKKRLRLASNAVVDKAVPPDQSEAIQQNHAAKRPVPSLIPRALLIKKGK